MLQKFVRIQDMDETRPQKQRRKQLSAHPLVIHRAICSRCRRAQVACYCTAIKPFAAPFEVGILQHPYEFRNAIATGRMTHLSILNSHLFVGIDFSSHQAVNRLLNDSSYRHVILYPGIDATPFEEVVAVPSEVDGRRLFVWVVDAKWQHVHQMFRRSPNLRAIPMTKFTPTIQSQFIIRKQPDSFCLSTIESMHFVIESFNRHRGVVCNEHAALLDAFQFLVQQQLEFARTRQDSRHRRNKEIRIKSI